MDPPLRSKSGRRFGRFHRGGAGKRRRRATKDAELVADFILERLHQRAAPQLSAHALRVLQNVQHLEYFDDHVRIKLILFDDVLEPEDGVLKPKRSRPGHGLELRRADAER